MDEQLTQPSTNELPQEAQNMLARIEADARYAGRLFYREAAESLVHQPWAKEVLMAAVRKNPACALCWFSCWDAPFAGELFDEAAQRDPKTLLEIAMEGHPRFEKIRELIWKYIGRSAQGNGTLWRVEEGQFVSPAAIQRMIAEKRMKLSDVLKEFGL